MSDVKKKVIALCLICKAWKRKCFLAWFPEMIFISSTPQQKRFLIRWITMVLKGAYYNLKRIRVIDLLYKSLKDVGNWQACFT